MSNVVGQAVENCSTRIPWSLLKKDGSMIRILQNTEVSSDTFMVVFSAVEPVWK